METPTGTDQAVVNLKTTTIGLCNQSPDSLAKQSSYRRNCWMVTLVGCAFLGGLGVGKGFLSFHSPIAASPVAQIDGVILPVSGPFILQKDGYLVCYDGRTHNAMWVYEHLTPGDLSGEVTRREAFREESQIPRFLRATLTDYERSGYDRGHLAAAANHRRSQVEMDETFLLSNISPQVGPLFNRQGGGWARLENDVRAIAKASLSTQVISGPLFLPSTDTDGTRAVRYPVVGKGDIAVPTHFFKIVSAEMADGTSIRKAFVLPNQSISPQCGLAEFEVGIEEVERLAGIVFTPLPSS